MITCLWYNDFLCPYDHCMGRTCPTFRKNADDQLTNTTHNTNAYCKEKGIWCVFATEYGCCKLTACMRRTV